MIRASLHLCFWDRLSVSQPFPSTLLTSQTFPQHNTAVHSFRHRISKTMASSFPVPFVHENPSGWGPPAKEVDTETMRLSHIYAPFGRNDRLGRAADFTSQPSNQFKQRYDRRRYDEYGRNAEFQYKVEGDDFELVDTAKASVKRFVTPSAKKRTAAQNRLKQLNARSGGRESSYDPRNSQQFQRTRRGTGRGMPGGRGGPGRGMTWRDRLDRQASVSIKSDWKLIADLDLIKITKQPMNTSKPQKEEDLLFCGFVDTYNDNYEKCTTKVPTPLKRFENKEFYPVTTTDDPVIEKLAIDGTGNVFATDAILAHLMTCPRSVNPWDIVVQKLPSGALFFDKRESSQFDYLTVNETANVPPAKLEDDPEGINTVERLCLEATTINQNFSQQILKAPSATTRKQFDLPNPFFDDENNEGMEPASVAYRYRLFELGDGIELVCRTELHGIVKRSSLGSNTPEELYMTAFALNEYHGPVNMGSISWREKLDSQRGAVLATELKNNSYKLAKWTAQSILADAYFMKIGFVSRSSPKNPFEHQILATQFYRPREFAQQITLNEGSMWGIIRMLINTFRDHPEGKYVLVRDPNKPILRIFSVPPNTFEEEDTELATSAPVASEEA